MLGFPSLLNLSATPLGTGGAPDAQGGGADVPETAEAAELAGFQAAFARTASPRSPAAGSGAPGLSEDAAPEVESVGTPVVGDRLADDDNAEADPGTESQVGTDRSDLSDPVWDETEIDGSFVTLSHVSHPLGAGSGGAQAADRSPPDGGEAAIDGGSIRRSGPANGMPASGAPQAGATPRPEHGMSPAGTTDTQRVQTPPILGMDGASPSIADRRASQGDAMLRAAGGRAADVASAAADTPETSAPAPEMQRAPVSEPGRSATELVTPAKIAAHAMLASKTTPYRKGEEPVTVGAPRSDGAGRGDAPVPALGMSAANAPGDARENMGHGPGGAALGGPPGPAMGVNVSIRALDEGEVRGVALHDFPLSGEARSGHPTLAEPRGATSASGTAPQMARHVAVQISEAMAKGGDRPIDLTLNPSELGRVRITLHPGDGGMVVNVVADRPETLDLMRRHSNVLGQEFRDLGYGGTDFTFSRDRGGDGRAPPSEVADYGADGGLQDPALAGDGVPVRIAPNDRLDIRL